MYSISREQTTTGTWSEQWKNFYITEIRLLNFIIISYYMQYTYFIFVEDIHTTRNINIRKCLHLWSRHPGDEFTHRPWPRAARFWGPAQLLPMTTRYLLKNCKTAQSHNFMFYFETSENTKVYTRDSYQYRNNTIILLATKYKNDNSAF